MARKPVWNALTYAHFECDYARGEFGAEPPSGREISERLQQRLGELGLEFGGPGEDCSYGWDLEHGFGAGCVAWNRIQFSGHDDDEQAWHTLLEVRRPFFLSFFGPKPDEIEQVQNIVSIYRQAVESIELKNIEWDDTGFI